MIVPVKEKYPLFKAMLACCGLVWIFQFLAYNTLELSLEVSFKLSTLFATVCLALFFRSYRKRVFGTSFNIGFSVLALFGFVVPLLLSIPSPPWLGVSPIQYAFLNVSWVVLVFICGTWYFFKKLKKQYLQIKGSLWELGSLTVDLKKFKLKSGMPYNPSLKQTLGAILFVLFLFLLNVLNAVGAEFAFLLALKWSTAFALSALLFSSIVAKALFLRTLETSSKKFKVYWT